MFKMAGSSSLCFVGCALVAMVAGGCIEEIGKDQKFGECMASFSGYFSNMGSQPDAPGGQNMMEVMCSQEGKSAMSCFFDYVAKCPDFASSSGMQLPGINIMDIMRDGGFDAYCELQSGPCSKFQECFSGMAGGMTGMRKKRGSQPPINHYQLFQAQAQMICQGPMKESVMCLSQVLKDCPPEVIKKVEEIFGQVMKGSLGGMKMIGFEDSSKFLEQQCPKMPQSFVNNTCLSLNFLSGDFQKCIQNMTNKYQKLDKCGVVTDNQDCVDKYLEPACDKESSDFLKENTRYIFTSVPQKCEHETSATSLTQAVFILTMAGALLATIF